CPEPVIPLIRDLERGHDEHLRDAAGEGQEEEHVLEARPFASFVDATPVPLDRVQATAGPAAGTSRRSTSLGRAASTFGQRSIAPSDQATRTMAIQIHVAKYVATRIAATSAISRRMRTIAGSRKSNANMWS